MLKKTIPLLLIILFNHSCTNIKKSDFQNIIKNLNPILKNISQDSPQYDEDISLPELNVKTIPYELVLENRKLEKLKDFADNDSVLDIKWKMLNDINNSRKKYKLKPLKLNILACRVANMHCKDMVNKKYFSHYSKNGLKPYHRWGLNGGLDHISENLHSRVQNVPLLTSLANILYYMRTGHKRFMDEKPPNDGHRKEILNSNHTHAGIGFAIKEKEFRYSELYVDKYLEINPNPSFIPPGRITIRGKVLEPEKYGLFLAVAYYDKKNISLPENVRNSPYPDFSEVKLTQVPPWKLKYDTITGNFVLPITFKGKKSGYAYIQIFVKENPNKIPYKPERTVQISSKNSICAGGVIVELP
ncbi:MAG: CAP domain-containing protein [Candidatus Coatesbacteria bacterium]|nr:CAP domain-containing protein [Candidatus Coatesbacteria bacterium]